MTRVQIPAYTDHWMMGDRYGEVMSILRVGKGRKGSLETKIDPDGVEMAHVVLDKSGKIVRVILADCEVVA